LEIPITAIRAASDRFFPQRDAVGARAHGVDLRGLMIFVATNDARFRVDADIASVM